MGQSRPYSASAGVSGAGQTEEQTQEREGRRGGWRALLVPVCLARSHRCGSPVPGRLTDHPSGGGVRMNPSAGAGVFGAVQRGGLRGESLVFFVTDLTGPRGEVARCACPGPCRTNARR